MTKLSILTISTLFPNAAQPAHGAFVATRLRKLVESGEVDAEVIAPMPWVPRGTDYRGTGGLAHVPRHEIVQGLSVHHPRYLVIPKIGMTLTPYLMYRALLREFRQLTAAGKKFDLIDAHYFYPDGVAASWLARAVGLPISITARGTDLNLIPQFALPRRMIRKAALRADRLITVCQALKEPLLDLGIPASKVHVLRNGVDLMRFSPLDRPESRKSFGLKRKTLASVGLLVERKGHHHIIRALRDLPDLELLIAGDGPDRANLEALAVDCGVHDRVRFLGLLSQSELPRLYSAADILVLASSREGWANVLLEAMACGTPVVASAVWGTPEVVQDERAGVLMPSLDSRGVVEGVKKLLAQYPDHQLTRQYAEQFDWDDTTRGQLELFRTLKKPLAQTAPNSDLSYFQA